MQNCMGCFFRMYHIPRNCAHKDMEVGGGLRHKKLLQTFLKIENEHLFSKVRKI